MSQSYVNRTLRREVTWNIEMSWVGPPVFVSIFRVAADGTIGTRGLLGVPLAPGTKKQPIRFVWSTRPGIVIPPGEGLRAVPDVTGKLTLDVLTSSWG